MKERELFRTLIKSYYDGNFDEIVANMLSEGSHDKDHLSKMIASLFGVEVDYNAKNYTTALKHAVSNYSPNQKVVSKIKPCTIECTVVNGKTQCQNSCPFDAISIDAKNHTTYIENDKCTDCGFCVDACPNKNYLDKVEFFPLINIM